MKKSVKLLLWGLLPLAVGKLYNVALGAGIYVYPVVDIAFLAFWGWLAYTLCDKEDRAQPQFLMLLAPAQTGLVLTALYHYGPESLKTLVWWSSYFFSAGSLLMAELVGNTFYRNFGEPHLQFLLSAATFCVYAVIAIVCMTVKKKK